MRTTLTIEDDVAAVLERLRKTRHVGLKAVVNEALRRGLQEMTRQAKRREPFRTRSLDLGRVLVGSIDNVAETLAVAEGEAFH